MNVSYDHYKFFYQVAKCGNTTAAARQLNTNQPNVTRVIKTLEAQLGILLFQRSRRGMSLTPEGEKFFDLLAPAMERIMVAESEIAEAGSLSQGNISLSVTEIGLRCFLLPVLKKFRANYPGIHLRLYNHSTTEAAESVVSGLSDLAVITTPLKNNNALSICEMKRFQEILVCGKTFEYLIKKSYSIQQLTGIPFISLGHKSATFECYSRWFAGLGLEFKPEILVETADQILPLVKNGIGIGFIPVEMIPEKEREIFPIQLRENPPCRSICLVKKKNGILNAAAKIFESISLNFR